MKERPSAPWRRQWCFSARAKYVDGFFNLEFSIKKRNNSRDPPGGVSGVFWHALLLSMQLDFSKYMGYGVLKQTQPDYRKYVVIKYWYSEIFGIFLCYRVCHIEMDETKGL